MFTRILETVYWLLVCVVVAGVLFFAVAGVAAADVMTEQMRTDHDTYRAEFAAERRAALIAVNVEAAPAASGPSDQTMVGSGEEWLPQTTGVEQWRGLTERYFGGNTDAALRIIACESGGNPDAKNPDSSASGLFQHLARYWADRSVAAGWAGADIFDPEANIAVAAWLSDGGASWAHWTCQP